MAVDYGRLLSVFFSEASQQLDALNSCVLELEVHPAKSTLLDEIFRHAHSLKGGASSFGFHALSTVTHEFESFLTAVKAGTVPVNTGNIDTMLAALDAMRVLVDHQRRGDDADEDSEEAAAEAGRVREALLVVGRLREAAGREAAGDDDPLLAGEGLLEPPTAFTFDGPSLEQARELSSAGRRLVEVEVHFERDMAMPSMRVFLLYTNVERVSTIVVSRPLRDEIDDEAFGGLVQLLVCLDDDVDEETLRRACEIDCVTEVTLSPFIESCADGAAEDAPVETGEDQQLSAAPAGEERSPADPASAASTEAVAPSEGFDERLEQLAAMLGTGADKFLRIAIDKVDGLLHLASELSSERNKLHKLFLELRPALTKKSGRLLEELLDKQEQLLGHLRDDVMAIRMVPLRELFQRFPRLVRDLSRAMGKEVEFAMEGEGTELDKKVVDRLADPLVHLLRNAVDHGIEAPAQREAAGKPRRGKLVLRASHRGHLTVIELEDDGAGVDCRAVRERVVALGLVDQARAAALADDALLEYLFMPGLSTKMATTQYSGRGVGLDAVKEGVQSLNGSVALQSRYGAGSCFSIEVPLTLAMTDALLVAVGDETYAMPVSHVQGTMLDETGQVMTLEGRGRYYEIDDRPVPYFELAQLLDVPSSNQPASIGTPRPLVHVCFREREAVVAVERFIGQEEMIIKSLAEHYHDVDGFAGASLLGDGQVVLILDLPTIIGRQLHGGAIEESRVSSRCGGS